MLPDIRAVIAAVVAAMGLLMISFGLVATFRVAQDLRAGVLQADLAQRGRSPVPVGSEARTIPIIEALEPPPATHEYAEALEATPVTPVITAAPLLEPIPVTPVIVAAPLPEPIAPASEPPTPPAELPIGGPLPEQIAAVHAEPPPRNVAAEKAAKKAAARKARASRIARERKAAARRAVQIRRARQNAAAASDNGFANPFGNSFGNSPFGQRN